VLRQESIFSGTTFVFERLEDPQTITETAWLDQRGRLWDASNLPAAEPASTEDDQ
jgi:hypothetical protein